MTESDPNGKSKHEAGAKMDAGKSPVVRGAIQYFPLALKEVAAVSAKGAAKYSWRGWESVPDGFNRYSDALGRHLVDEALGPVDADTGELHAAQVAWNALARLELMLRRQHAADTGDDGRPRHDGASGAIGGDPGEFKAVPRKRTGSSG